MRARYLSETEKAVLREARGRRWRSTARQQGVSDKAQQRLEWMIFYDTVGQRNAWRTAGYFGIAAKTFPKWKGRFDPQNMHSLEDQPRRPKKFRGWEVSLTQQARVRRLRKRYPRYGKAKLKILYEQTYHEPISTWKIERVIRFFQLYPDPERVAQRAKRQQQKPKARIHEAQNLSELLLWHTDTIQLRWYGQRRYIFTAPASALPTSILAPLPARPPISLTGCSIYPRATCRVFTPTMAASSPVSLTKPAASSVSSTFFLASTNPRTIPVSNALTGPSRMNGWPCLRLASTRLTKAPST